MVYTCSSSSWTVGSTTVCPSRCSLSDLCSSSQAVCFSAVVVYVGIDFALNCLSLALFIVHELRHWHTICKYIYLQFNTNAYRPYTIHALIITIVLLFSLLSTSHSPHYAYLYCCYMIGQEYHYWLHPSRRRSLLIDIFPASLSLAPCCTHAAVRYTTSVFWHHWHTSLAQHCTTDHLQLKAVSHDLEVPQWPCSSLPGAVVSTSLCCLRPVSTEVQLVPRIPTTSIDSQVFHFFFVYITSRTKNAPKSTDLNAVLNYIWQSLQTSLLWRAPLYGEKRHSPSKERIDIVQNCTISIQVDLETQKK